MSDGQQFAPIASVLDTRRLYTLEECDTIYRSYLHGWHGKIMTPAWTDQLLAQAIGVRDRESDTLRNRIEIIAAVREYVK